MSDNQASKSNQYPQFDRRLAKFQQQQQMNLAEQQLNSEVNQLNSQVNQLNVTLTSLLVHPPTAPYAFIYGYVTTPCGGIACGPHTPLSGNITFVPYNATYPRIFVSVTGGSGFYQANLTLTVEYLAHISVTWDTGNPSGCYQQVTINTAGITRLDIWKHVRMLVSLRAPVGYVVACVGCEGGDSLKKYFLSNHWMIAYSTTNPITYPIASPTGANESPAAKSKSMRSES